MPPKNTGRHQNSTAWVAYQNQESLKPSDEVLRGSTDRCCEKCVEVIEWRKKFGKYKVLQKASRCHSCQEKAVMKAYHGVCQACSSKLKVCAKCEKPFAECNDGAEREAKEASLRAQLALLPERYRRSAERKLEKAEGNYLQDVEKVIHRAIGKRAKDKDGAESSGEEEQAPAGTAAPKVAAAPSAPVDDDSDSDEVM